MDSHDTLIEIIRVCLKMDEKAESIYGYFGRIAEDEDLKSFWNHMMYEEQQHVFFWNKLLNLAKEKLFPQIFIRPDDILRELSNNYNIINELSKKTVFNNISESLIFAFRLEFYLLHPALEQLWHFYGAIREGEYNPESEYDNHINKFIEAMHKYGAATTAIEALAETVEKMRDLSKNMAKDANFDELTNIFNRRGLFNAIISMAYLSKRNKFHSAILMIDIDHFKRVNDTLGHLTGDNILRKVADIIKNSMRVSDVLGRFGGEEFLVFLPQVDNKGVFNIAEKIRKNIQEETSLEIPVTASIGVSSTIIDGVVEDTIHELIKKADEHLYEAKKAGRNQVVC